MPAIVIIGNFAYRLLNSGLVEHMKVDLTQFKDQNFGTTEFSSDERDMKEFEDEVVHHYLVALHPYFAEKFPSGEIQAEQTEAPDPNAAAGTHDRQ